MQFFTLTSLTLLLSTALAYPRPDKVFKMIVKVSPGQPKKWDKWNGQPIFAAYGGSKKDTGASGFLEAAFYDLIVSDPQMNDGGGLFGLVDTAVAAVDKKQPNGKPYQDLITIKNNANYTARVHMEFESRDFVDITMVQSNKTGTPWGVFYTNSTGLQAAPRWNRGVYYTSPGWLICDFGFTNFPTLYVRKEYQAGNYKRSPVCADVALIPTYVK
ncbi:Hypothetical protein D9617_1g087260 [Elsinoe fawcettii]|nr:Hypothetical protein D9617_1g087260 [Elsinoe fawcettii]